MKPSWIKCRSNIGGSGAVEDLPKHPLMEVWKGVDSMRFFIPENEKNAPHQSVPEFSDVPEFSEFREGRTGCWCFCQCARCVFSVDRMDLKRIPQFIGFERKKLWWYRDLALTVTAWMLTGYSVSSLAPPGDPAERAFGLACALMALVACIVSPNRHVIFLNVLGLVAVQGWLAVIRTEDRRAWLLAVPATVIAFGYFWWIKDRPIKEQ